MRIYDGVPMCGCGQGSCNCPQIDLNEGGESVTLTDTARPGERVTVETGAFLRMVRDPDLLRRLEEAVNA